MAWRLQISGLHDTYNMSRFSSGKAQQKMARMAVRRRLTKTRVCAYRITTNDDPENQ
jgi:hypothetical protein